MFAVVKTGGKQYKVAPNDVITVEKLAGAEGDSIKLSDVLMVGDDKGTTIGDPLVKGTTVTAEILEQGRADPEATPEWALAFDDWLAAAVTGGDAQAIVNYRAEAPHAALAHPSEEHYLPLPVAMGAGGADGRSAVLHRGFSYGSLSMAVYAFGVAE